MSGGGQGKGVSQHHDLPFGVRVPTSVYGAAIAVAYGRCRIGGNVIWCGHLPYGFAMSNSDQNEIVAGFGGAQPTTLQPNYFLSLEWGLCEGPIRGVRTFYKRDTRYVLNQVNIAALNQTPPGPQVPPFDEYFDHQDSDGTIQSHWSSIESSWTPIRVFRGAAGQPAWTDQKDNSDYVNVDGVILTLQNLKFLPPSPAVHYPYLAYVARHGWPIYNSTDLPSLDPDVIMEERS